MSFLHGMPGTRLVTLVKRPGSPDEERTQVQGNLQSKQGFFGRDVRVEAGDVIEEPDPRPGMPVIRRSVRHVEVHQGGPLSHIEVTWGDPPPAPKPSPTPLKVGNLHPSVQTAAAALYTDGHVAQAVFEAFKAVESQIRDMTGIDESGAKLAGRAFGGASPPLKLSERPGRMGDDEREGRRLVIMGALQSIRNLGAHELAGVDPEMATELLGLASLIMRWLDHAAPASVP